MKIPRALRFTKREVAFLSLTFFVFAAGLFICAEPSRTKWVPGLGALIIIFGIVFAVSDLPAILQLQADKWAKVRKEFLVQNRINKLEEEEHEVLTEAKRGEVRCEQRALADKQLPSAGPLIRKRFRFVEVFIVCLGTAVNGFGQPLLELFIARTAPL